MYLPRLETLSSRIKIAHRQGISTYLESLDTFDLNSTEKMKYSSAVIRIDAGNALFAFIFLYLHIKISNNDKKFTIIL